LLNQYTIEHIDERSIERARKRARKSTKRRRNERSYNYRRGTGNIYIGIYARIYVPRSIMKSLYPVEGSK